MEDDALKQIAAAEIEILPPERDDLFDESSRTCLCCGRSRSFIDEDGCGICEECLAP
ncbi:MULTISPECIES: hypothetical protein [unclassified Rhizobium]|uniref:hypothetical protein n=1 Tax=unclassified Rhizobium TaxID=2613769 RepID=UPI0037FA5F88